VLFNEPKLLKYPRSACGRTGVEVSVLFNEPKLLKSQLTIVFVGLGFRFSALQRAEIAEIVFTGCAWFNQIGFQCSSTSRNC
jgi:hypothetical protein